MGSPLTSSYPVFHTLAGVAKKTGNPYSSLEREGHMFNFKPVSDHYCKYLQEEVSAKSPDWTKIRSLMVEKDKPDLLFVKYCLEEERYTQVHIGRNQTTSTFGPVPVLPKDSSVTDAKKQDLLYMCNELIIAKDYHDFYKNLIVCPVDHNSRDTSNSMDECEDDKVREVGENVEHSSCRPAESKKRQRQGASASRQVKKKRMTEIDCLVEANADINVHRAKEKNRGRSTLCFHELAVNEKLLS